MKKAMEKIIMILSIIWTVLLIILIFAAAFTPGVHVTTYEDISNMGVRERIRIEQRIW